mgnify:CR=1 FL=1|tara:strand:+ start:1295 stop:2416 length:1122 start_codon:yes stop_codon:yes gene_type:complete
MASKARQLAQSASAPEGRKNIVTNGAMNVAQRSISVAGIGASAGYFTVDRFNINANGTSGRLAMTQTADGPSGFANCIQLDCTTADTDMDGNKFIILEQRFEGQDLQRFMKGTSDAKEYAVSFYVKGNASATYIAELFDTDNSRQASKTFSVTTSWTRVELTFPADTTGAFDDDNAQSLNLHLFLVSGTTYTSGTLSQTWTSNSGNNANRAVGGGNFFSSTDNTFFITGVQLEVGSVATEFEHRSYAEELALCQRYYQKFEGTTSNYESITVGYNQGTGNHVGVLYTNVPMRSTGIALETTGTASDYVILHQATVQNLTSVPVLYAYASIPQNDEIINVTLTGTTGSGLTAQGGSILSFTNSAGKTLAIEDEL